MTKKLNFSVPANNWKIIELYNKIRKEELDPSPSFQRKLVWKKQHKFKFIETTLLNYPFPEIYIAPGEMDTDTLQLKDMIVDGQQRCTTLVDYIESKDVFALSNIPIKKFTELSKEEKEDFLNYEVSIRYLKNATQDQTKEIFQRINSTEYSLNATERINAKWGDSEFVLFGKQILDKEQDLNFDIISYKLDNSNKKILNDFFIKEFKVFNENDVKRMLALQYILTLLSTIIEESYFRRNDKTQAYIEQYNEEFINAGEVEITLTNVVKLITKLTLDEKSYWFNKANVFSLIIELYKYDITSIDIIKFKNRLNKFEEDYRRYLNSSDDNKFSESIDGQIKYFEFSREGVNEIVAREHRGNMITSFITSSLN